MRTQDAGRRSRYIPALDYDWLTPAYDMVLRTMMPEDAFRRQLIERARLFPGSAVLDVGCGTGTLAIQVKRSQPEAMVVGLDGDLKILAIAERKVARAGVAVGLQAGMAYELPYADASFDRVLSSLVFHHLTSADKRRALAECHRVLRPAGELHLADWGKAHNALMWAASWLMRLFEGAERTADNVRGLLPDLCREAGFESVTETTRFATLFGTLSLYRGLKAGAATASRSPAVGA